MDGSGKTDAEETGDDSWKGKNIEGKEKWSIEILVHYRKAIRIKYFMLVLRAVSHRSRRRKT